MKKGARAVPVARRRAEGPPRRGRGEPRSGAGSLGAHPAAREPRRRLGRAEGPRDGGARGGEGAGRPGAADARSHAHRRALRRRRGSAPRRARRSRHGQEGAGAHRRDRSSAALVRHQRAGSRLRAHGREARSAGASVSRRGLSRRGLLRLALARSSDASDDPQGLGAQRRPPPAPGLVRERRSRDRAARERDADPGVCGGLRPRGHLRLAGPRRGRRARAGRDRSAQERPRRGDARDSLRATRSSPRGPTR